MQLRLISRYFDWKCGKILVILTCKIRVLVQGLDCILLACTEKIIWSSYWLIGKIITENYWIFEYLTKKQI